MDSLEKITGEIISGVFVFGLSFGLIYGMSEAMRELVENSNSWKKNYQGFIERELGELYATSYEAK